MSTFVPDPAKSYECGSYVVSFDTRGRLVGLKRGGVNGRSAGRQWLDADHTIGGFEYRTYSQADFDEFALEWNNHFGDFSKPGVASAGAESRLWDVKVVSALQQRHSDGSYCEFVFQYAFEDARAQTLYGAPGKLEVSYTVPGKAAAVDMNITWSEKQATRLPESMWVRFTPAPVGSWTLDVMGQDICPLNVVARGTRFKHYVQEGGATLRASHGESFQVRMIDTGLVSPGGSDKLLRYARSDEQPDMTKGISANLHNNLWGTAFPQYYGFDGQARFQIVI